MFENFKKSNLCGARVVLVMGDWLLGGVCGGLLFEGGCGSAVGD